MTVNKKKTDWSLFLLDKNVSIDKKEARDHTKYPSLFTGFDQAL